MYGTVKTLSHIVGLRNMCMCIWSSLGTKHALSSVLEISDVTFHMSRTLLFYI